ncbi:hypothetical protein H1S01_15720 [Heliobacterium chlorum]|uniref:Uncharacterized protein n=1 Tax=Heliobacterium chlorum TaxID=2698 RepID=A0ABR7T7U6_HELCL|nr:hypothetical protein [Heliobacterium chlorum]MBC9785934.1 hypothetical protein [Heliobacterium chlorum]
MRFIRTLFLGSFFMLFLYLCFAMNAAEYAFSEESSLRKSFPYQDGIVVYEKQFGNKNLVIWDTGSERYVKLVNQNLGILYRVQGVALIESKEVQKKIKTAWASHRADDDRYDTLLAVEIIDPNINKVIVTNEGYTKNLSTLEEVKEQSKVYVELDVINGYAAHYFQTSNTESMGFVFRGLNQLGEIVTVSW